MIYAAELEMLLLKLTDNQSVHITLVSAGVTWMKGWILKSS